MSSMNNLSVDGEFRYIVTWFTEWSVLQREDFVPILVAWLTHHDAALSSAPDDVVAINGVTNSVANADINDKPMSLFQCRIKLFNEWSPKWPLDFKYKLKEKIIEIDAKVGEKIVNEIKGHSNGNNGIDVEMENENEDGEATAVAEIVTGGVAANAAAAESVVSDNGGDTAAVADVDVEATEAAVFNADNNLAAVLNIETPVDDEDDVKDENDDNKNNVEVQTTVATHTEELADPVVIQQTHDEEPVAAATAVTVTNSIAEVPSIA